MSKKRHNPIVGQSLYLCSSLQLCARVKLLNEALRSRIGLEAEEGALLLPTLISRAAGGWRLHCLSAALAQADNATRISTNLFAYPGCK